MRVNVTTSCLMSTKNVIRKSNKGQDMGMPTLLDLIKKHFGNSEFTAKELCEKTGRSKGSVYKSLWHMVNRSKTLVKVGDDYQLVNNEKTKRKENESPIRRDDILRLVSNKFGDEKFNPSDIAKVTGISNKNILNHLQRLHDDRCIKRVGRGTYAISTKGHNRVASLCGVKQEQKQEQKEGTQPGLLEFIESTWDKNSLYKWATKIVTQDPGWKEFGEELVGRAALCDERCRGLIEEKAKDAIRSMMPK